MKYIKFILPLLIIIFSSFTTDDGTDPVVAKIIEIGQADNQVMHQLDMLCNRFGGRLIGSNAYDNAAEWVAHQFREWGMQVELDEAGELPIGFNRGPWFGKMIADEGMSLHFATCSYTAGTKGVQRGHVLIAPKTQAEFNSIKGKLKGAWVLIGGMNRGFPIDISAEADRARDSIIALNSEIAKQNNEIRIENRNNKKQKELLPYHEEPALFYRQMVEAGILGIIQASKIPIRAQYDRKNIMNMSFDNLPQIPDIKLNEHQYEIIKQKVEERQYFQLEFDIRNHFRMGPVKYHNVIGMIPGTEFPDEYVMMGGHLDAYDVATGGVDDGSGASVAIEAARLIMKAGGKPKRTILFCLWAGEEFGLLGSSSWIRRNPDKLEKISNLFNRDGGPSCALGISVTDAMREDMEKVCAPLNSINPEFPFEIKSRKPRPQPLRPWATDSGPFAVMGVPTMGFNTGYPRGDDFDYHEIWHTERDLYNKSIPAYQEHTAVVTAVVVYGIANLDHLLDREGYYIPTKGEKTLDYLRK
jgi:carboxypeptidase Q